MNVVPRGLEPRTLRLLAVRSNQLSYETNCKCKPGTDKQEEFRSAGLRHVLCGMMDLTRRWLGPSSGRRCPPFKMIFEVGAEVKAAMASRSNTTGNRLRDMHTRGTMQNGKLKQGLAFPIQLCHGSVCEFCRKKISKSGTQTAGG